MVPELNDLYSGWETKQAWRKICHDKVKNDKNVYMKLLKQFIDNEKDDIDFDIKNLCQSYNKQFGNWDDKQNIELYKEIIALL